MQWNDLWVTLALVMIIEGLLPFINPRAFRQYLISMQELSDESIRRIGLILLLAGAASLFFLK